VGTTQEKMAKEMYCSKFSGKYISLKYNLFYAVFDADSEYHVYFAPKPIFDSQNVEILYQEMNIASTVKGKAISKKKKVN